MIAILLLITILIILLLGIALVVRENRMLKQALSMVPEDSVPVGGEAEVEEKEMPELEEEAEKEGKDEGGIEEEGEVLPGPPPKAKPPIEPYEDEMDKLAPPAPDEEF